MAGGDIVAARLRLTRWPFGPVPAAPSWLTLRLSHLCQLPRPPGFGPWVGIHGDTKVSCGQVGQGEIVGGLERLVTNC